MIEQPLTIYFDLAPEARPTIGAVGEAMVQFEKMAGEAVFLIEPGVEFSLVVERSETVTAPRRDFYRAVEPDKAITGVGAAPNEKEERPAVVVPRSEFSDRSGAVIEKRADGETDPRVLSERVQVVLANAPLIESKAKWRIFLNGHQISVKMLDANFQKQVLDGTTQLRLAGGVILDVTLETTQVYADGVWQNKSYAIPEVHSWRQNPAQAELLLSHSSDHDDQNEQNAQ